MRFKCDASCLEGVLGMLAFGGFQKWGYPQVIHLNRIFPCKRSILGYPHIWKLRYLKSRKSSLKRSVLLKRHFEVGTCQGQTRDLRDLWLVKAVCNVYNVNVHFVLNHLSLLLFFCWTPWFGHSMS